eukprot:COSAG02_NODE_4136_length_5728_cov_5.776692_2_plen_55_part_00
MAGQRLLYGSVGRSEGRDRVPTRIARISERRGGAGAAADKLSLGKDGAARPENR